MSGYTDLTPAQLADRLELARQFPHNAGALSALDEATLAYGWRYPAVEGPQKAFASARLAHMRSYTTESGTCTDESWGKAVEAARNLAAVLRPLGDAVIPRCQRPTGWGTCNFPLEDDGTCRGRDHADSRS